MTMVYHLLLCFTGLIVDLFAAITVASIEKDLEIILLRQQLRILERKLKTQPRPSRPQKLILVAIATRLKSKTDNWRDRWNDALLLFKPDTLLKWDRELVRRKWTFQHPNRGGRPPVDAELEALIVQLARENPRMGYDKIHGELLKLGFCLNSSTIKNVLRRNRVQPAPQRGHSSWRTFLNHYRHQMLACDFFTVETIRLQTLYVLFFIELKSRRVYLAGCTPSPNKVWVTQQARQWVWRLSEDQRQIDFLIHDRDTKFCGAFNSVFVSEGIEVVLTPFRAPKADAIAERWVRSVREECLDQLLILNEAHLTRVLSEYIGYYNSARPHQGLEQQAPIPFHRTRTGDIHRWDVLGGILHEYSRKTV
jgi:putative transposase